MSDSSKRKSSPRSGRRRSYHHGDLPRALLDASLALIAERGARGFTLREVARQAGVSHAAPYRHFRDREALLAAVAEEGFRDFHEALLAARASAPADRPLEQLEAIGVGYLRFACDHPSHFRVMFGPDVRVPSHPSVHESSKLGFVVLVETIAACQASGALRPGDPVKLAIGPWSLVHGLASLAIDDHLAFADPAPVDEIARRLTRDALEGLLARPEP